MPEAEPDRIEQAVRAVLSSLSGDLSLREAALLAELHELGRMVARAKAEIAALQVEDITGRHIPAATDELDAIVAHTAEATHTILDACEQIEALQLPLEASAAASTRRRDYSHLRGLLLPGHHRAEDRQGGGGAEGDRTAHRRRRPKAAPPPPRRTAPQPPPRAAPRAGAAVAGGGRLAGRYRPSAGRAAVMRAAAFAGLLLATARFSLTRGKHRASRCGWATIPAMGGSCSIGLLSLAMRSETPMGWCGCPSPPRGARSVAGSPGRHAMWRRSPPATAG